MLEATMGGWSRRRMLAGGASLLTASAVVGRAHAAGADRYAKLAEELGAVARAGTVPDQPTKVLAELDRALAATVGHKLFTVLVINLDKDLNQRYYSNQPKAYPTGGSKPIVRSNAFFKEIVEAGRPRICYNYEDVKAAFFDHELIRSLGCESAVNYPVRWNGKTIGSLNLLHEANWYGEKDLPPLASFSALTVPAIMDIVRGWG